MRLLDREGLKEKGINHSYTQLWRMMSAGKFPRPVKVGARNAWVEFGDRRLHRGPHCGA